MGYKEVDTDNGAWRECQKIQHVENPSETIGIGDTTDWITSGLSDYGHLFPYFSTWISVGDRHGRGINLLFVDGHVNWKSQKELYYIHSVDGITNYYYKKRKTAQGY